MILVTGGTGMVGSRLVKGLADRGLRVKALSLPGDPFASRLAAVECRIESGDISRRESLVHLLDGVKTVCHLAAVILSADPTAFQRVNVDGTRNLVEEATAAGVEHFIYVSSAAALYPESSDYARSKHQAEEIVRSQGRMKFTIVRPTLIYGHGDGQEYKIFEQFLKRHPVVPMVGFGRAKKNPIHVDDFVQALLAIAGNPKTHDRMYNLGGGEELSIWRLAKLIAQSQGLRRWFIPIPVPLCRALARVMEKTMRRPMLTQYAISRMVCEANLDHDDARKDLGFRPRGISEGLKKEKGASRLSV